MDIVVIGKKSQSYTDIPHVVYCGRNFDDAQKAVNDSDPSLVRFYEIKYADMGAPMFRKKAAAPTESKEASAPVTESPKKKK